MIEAKSVMVSCPLSWRDCRIAMGVARMTDTWQVKSVRVGDFHGIVIVRRKMRVCLWLFTKK